MLMPDLVSTPEEALLYVTDCTLATVEWYAGRKSRPAGEFRRQKEMAQRFLNWLLDFDVSVEGSRAEIICDEFECSVERWARAIVDGHR